METHARTVNKVKNFEELSLTLTGFNSRNKLYGDKSKECYLDFIKPPKDQEKLAQALITLTRFKASESKWRSKME